MKKYNLILTAVFFLLSVSSFQYIEAQDKTKEDKLREQEDKSKMQEEITQQKKDMIEQSKHDDLQKELDKSRKQIDDEMQDLRNQIREYRDEKGQQREAGRRPDAPFAFSFPGFSFNGVFPDDDSERSSLNFSKSLKESNFSRDYIFDVAPTSKTVSMSINGFCKSGEIRIKIKMPNGKTYSDVVIDE